MTQKPQDLDYAGPNDGSDDEDQQLLADDYRWTFTVNFSSLVFGVFLFAVLLKDSLTSIFAIWIGFPVLLVHVAVGLVPALICLRRHGRVMTGAQKVVLLTLSGLAILVDVAGMVCAAAGIRLWR